MSTLTLRGNVSGTGTFIVESPNSNTNRTISLPDATTTLVGTDATQTLTNKTIQGGALTLMTAQPATSGLNIDFTGIPSWAKRVTVLFNGVSTSGAQSPFIQLGTSAGLATTGYDSRTVFIQASSLGTVAAFAGGFPFVPLATSAVRSGPVTFTNVTGNTWVASGVTVVASNLVETLGGVVTLAGALDRVRISAGGTDTFDLGSFNVMYEG